AVAGRERASRAAEAAVRETERFAGALRSLVRERPAALGAAVAGLLVSRACLVAIVPVIMAGLGWTGDPVPVMLSVVGVWALASASPTPGGTGAADAAMAAVLSAFAPVTVAGAAALLWRGVTFYFELFVGWVLFSRYLGRRGA
ncbi:MAG TPA: flippase-like domain-containing protein, partial [Coriobacteriia bacterium]